MIKNYDDFCTELLLAGFSLASGGNDEGVFALLKDNADCDCVRWHTGDAETDPWEWRIRVLDERSDIAYGKFFFRKSGYITKQWFPYFLSARRGDASVDDLYDDGKISTLAKGIYDVIRDHGAIPVHEIKHICGCAKEDKGRFDRALTDLQSGMFITTCGRRQKISVSGSEYGWASAMYCTAEMFWGGDVFDAAARITKADAESAIKAQIYKLNPNADAKKISKFIY